MRSHQIKLRSILMIWKACFANKLQVLQCQMEIVGAVLVVVKTLPTLQMKTRRRNKR